MKDLRPAPLLCRLFLGASAFLASGLPLAMADSLHIKKVAEYRNADKVQKVLREECQIDTRLPQIILEEVEKLSLFNNVSLIEDPLAVPHEFTLVASIITLEAPAGAGWSTAPKFLKVKAILYRDRENIGEYVRAERVVGSNDPIKNATKYHGNCRIAEHLAGEISEQLAVWIKKKNLSIKQTTSKSLPSGN